MDCNQESGAENQEHRVVTEMKNGNNGSFSGMNGNEVSAFVAVVELLDDTDENGNERGEKHEGMNTSVLICSQDCDMTEEIKGNVVGSLDSANENGNERGEKYEGRNTSVLICSQDCDRTEEIKGNVTVCVNQESIGGDSANVDENHKGDFLVGDLVWGKIKSHPWWPGLIYDPSDASDFASKFKSENKLLVAYFGDGSCAWCSRAQLVPFVDNYEKMSKQSGSNSFVYAVEEALEELGRRAELKMICSCVPEASLTDLVRPEAKNAGVRSGVLVPNGGIDKLRSLWCEPADLLDYVRNVGQAGPSSNLLERVLMKSRLSAFSRVKRGCRLPIYREPKPIEGLEDKSNNGIPDSNDFSVPITVPIQGPTEEEWDGSPKLLPVKGLMVTSTRKRKLKNVAELMIEDKGANLKNEDPVDDVEEDSDENTLRRFISRKRKDSKYLSAPYTTPTTKLLRSYSKMEVETKSDKSVKSAKVGDRLMKVAGQLISSPHLTKCGSAVSKEKISGKSLKLGPYAANSQEITTDISASANQVLEDVLSAGVDLMSIDRSSIEPLREFMSAYRSSTYLSTSKIDEPRSRVTKLKKAARAAASNKKDVDKTAQDTPIISFGSDASPVDFLQQKLMDFSSMLNQCEGKLSVEEKYNLESEMKCMLQKVGELAVKASS